MSCAETKEVNFHLACSENLACQLRSEVSHAEQILADQKGQCEKEKKELTTQLKEVKMALEQKQAALEDQMHTFQSFIC